MMVARSSERTASAAARKAPGWACRNAAPRSSSAWSGWIPAGGPGGSASIETSARTNASPAAASRSLSSWAWLEATSTLASQFWSSVRHWAAVSDG